MSNNNTRILSEPISYQELLSIHELKVSGIYKIENIINHKVYIGQSKDVIERLQRGHNINNEHNISLKRAYNKYGLDAFSFEVIKQTYDLDYWEIFLIQIYHATDNIYGYNITSGGEGGDTFSGRKHSEKTKKLMSLHNNMRNRVFTEEERYNMGYWRGKKHTDEYKKMMSNACKGINKGPKSEEHRRKISETLKGNIPGNKGMKMDKEFCDKQKQIKKELYSSEKGEHTKQLLREANVGLYFWHNGEIEIHSKEAPDGFSRGRLNAEHKVKYWYTNGMSDILVSICPKGYHYGRTFPNIKPQWYNNGIINVYAVNCPGLEFVKGQFHK